MNCKSTGVSRTPPTAHRIPSTTAKATAESMQERNPSRFSAPKCREIRMVAPAARPFIKLMGNRKSVCTESMAASAVFPAMRPTITASAVTYSCCTRLLSISGTTKASRAEPMGPEIRLSFLFTPSYLSSGNR